MNSVNIIGYLGQPPELRYTGKGTPVTKLSIAVKDVFITTEGEKREHTNWIQVSAWNRGAEIAQEYLHKGDRVAISGSLKYREFEVDGQKRSNLEVVANPNGITLIQSAGKNQGEKVNSNIEEGDPALN